MQYPHREWFLASGGLILKGNIFSSAISFALATSSEGELIDPIILGNICRLAAAFIRSY